jgi:hypothetical protein
MPSERQPAPVIGPLPGKRARTSSAYRDAAGGESELLSRSADAGAGQSQRRTNLDYAMLPPEVYAMEQAETAVSRASSGGGQPLPEELAARFSASLGADLGSVRIHTGSASASAARAVGAKAYAMGQDIHFAAGQYDPASPAGQHLLAHEVAHTVQQAGGTATRQNKLEISAPGDAHEQEAESAACAMVAGQPTTITTSTHGGVSRFWDEVQNLLGWGEDEEEVVATKAPKPPAVDIEADIGVQRARQDLAASQKNLEKAKQADTGARATRDQAKAALEAAKQRHGEASADHASKVPGTQANQRLAEAEKRTQAAEKAFEAANRAVERTERELKEAEANERVMYANVEQAKRDAQARGQAAAGGQ